MRRSEVCSPWRLCLCRAVIWPFVPWGRSSSGCSDWRGGRVVAERADRLPVNREIGGSQGNNGCGIPTIARSTYVPVRALTGCCLAGLGPQATACRRSRRCGSGRHWSAPGGLVFDQVNSASPATVTLGAAKVTFSVTARVAGGTWTYSSTVAMLQAWTASWRCTGTRCFALPGRRPVNRWRAGSPPMPVRRGRRERREVGPVHVPLAAGHGTCS
jgi:hypothetical protein